MAVSPCPAWCCADARAPGVVVAPRVRSASPLRGFLYAFWSRRSRLASARGGFPMGFMSVVNRERTGDHAGAAPAFRDTWPEYREDTDSIGFLRKCRFRLFACGGGAGVACMNDLVVKFQPVDIAELILR